MVEFRDSRPKDVRLLVLPFAFLKGPPPPAPPLARLISVLGTISTLLKALPRLARPHWPALLASSFVLLTSIFFLSTDPALSSNIRSGLVYGRGNGVDIDRDLAVVVSGMLRTFDSCLDKFWAKVVLPNDRVDVFLYLYYETDEERTRTMAVLDRLVTPSERDACSAYERSRLEAPKRMHCVRVVELIRWDERIFDEYVSIAGYPFPRKDLPTNVNTTISMFQGIQKANQLRVRYQDSVGVRYRFVLRWRADIKPVSRLVLGGLDYEPFFGFDRRYAWIPRGFDWGGLNDQIALAAPEVMDRYASVYDSISDIYERNITFHPERLIEAHLVQRHVMVRRWPFFYCLIRNNRHRKPGICCFNG
mmetsp:Transcript_5089/g.8750  ORF Transcript_5089/g.8750 Transcript_5089/m.8750 type:complete len:362 (+) Transcript_5089:259-1344(+)